MEDTCYRYGRASLEQVAMGYELARQSLVPCLAVPAKNPPKVEDGKPTKAMLAKGAHALSEWLNDNAPIGESRYLEPARSAWKAMRAAEPERPEPADVWVVFDGEGLPSYCAPWERAAHDHINDALQEHDIPDAAKWTVRRYVVAMADRERVQLVSARESLRQLRRATDKWHSIALSLGYDGMNDALAASPPVDRDAAAPLDARPRQPDQEHLETASTVSPVAVKG